MSTHANNAGKNAVAVALDTPDKLPFQKWADELLRHMLQRDDLAKGTLDVLIAHGRQTSNCFTRSMDP